MLFQSNYSSGIVEELENASVEFKTLSLLLTSRFRKILATTRTKNTKQPSAKREKIGEYFSLMFIF